VAIAIGIPLAAIGVPLIHLSAFVTTRALIAVSHRAEAIFCFLVDDSMLVTKKIVDQSAGLRSRQHLFQSISFCSNH